ncbi:MAG: hypothetical protein AB1705_23060 [Verrucomicrobiota bacterium]
MPHAKTAKDAKVFDGKIISGKIIIWGKLTERWADRKMGRGTEIKRMGSIEWGMPHAKTAKDAKVFMARARNNSLFILCGLGDLGVRFISPFLMAKSFRGKIIGKRGERTGLASHAA